MIRLMGSILYAELSKTNLNDFMENIQHISDKTQNKVRSLHQIISSFDYCVEFWANKNAHDNGEGFLSEKIGKPSAQVTPCEIRNNCCSLIQ